MFRASRNINTKSFSRLTVTPADSRTTLYIALRVDSFQGLGLGWG